MGKQARRAGVKARSFLRIGLGGGGGRKQRLLPDQPPGPYFLLPPSRREAGAQVFKQLLPYLSGEKLLYQREGERI